MENRISDETYFLNPTTNTVFDIDFVETHPESFEFIKELPVRDGSNQTIKAGIYRAKSIKFASVEEKDVEVYVLSVKALQSKIPGIQAILGLTQMLGHKWYFNNKKAVWGIY